MRYQNWATPATRSAEGPAGAADEAEGYTWSVAVRIAERNHWCADVGCIGPELQREIALLRRRLP